MAIYPTSLSASGSTSPKKQRQTSLFAPNNGARRAVSMPTIRVPFVNPSTPILPLSGPSNSSPGRVRSVSRRLNYNLKSRASHYSLPLALGGLCAVLFLVFQYTRPTHTLPRAPHLYSRSDRTASEPGNGISFLVENEDELIAEDDLFWDSYTDPDPLSDEEIAAQKEMKAHRMDVQQRDREHALQALVWWLAEGGIFPSGWAAPSGGKLKKITGRTMEKLLEGVDKGPEDAAIFEDGWAEYAKKMYRAVVFSKTYCPYSKRAKAILDTYHLNPAPFVIELDRRSDTQVIQNLLNGLTGRRTVPNVILDFTSVGGSDEVTLLHAEGGLQRRFEEMEMVPGARRRRRPKPQKPVPPPKVEKPVEAGAEPVQAEALHAAPVTEEMDISEPAIAAEATHDEIKRAIDEAHMISDYFEENAQVAEQELPVPLVVEDPVIRAAPEKRGVPPRHAEPLVARDTTPIVARAEIMERAEPAHIPRTEPALLAREEALIAAREPAPPNNAPIARDQETNLTPAETDLRVNLPGDALLKPLSVPEARNKPRNAPRFAMAPNPRQVQKNGAAALAAAAKIHRVRA